MKKGTITLTSSAESSGVNRQEPVNCSIRTDSYTHSEKPFLKRIISGGCLLRPGNIDTVDTCQYNLIAPFQRCLRGKSGKGKFQNSCLQGSFQSLSLKNESDDKQGKAMTVTGATGFNFRLSLPMVIQTTQSTENIIIGSGIY